MDELAALRELFHILDKRLTETDAWSRASIKALHDRDTTTDGNVQRLVDGMQQTRAKLYDSNNGRPGTFSLLDTWYYETLPQMRLRLDKLEMRQTWMMRTMVSGLVTLISGLGVLLLKR